MRSLAISLTLLLSTAAHAEQNMPPKEERLATASHGEFASWQIEPELTSAESGASDRLGFKGKCGCREVESAQFVVIYRTEQHDDCCDILAKLRRRHA